RLDYDGEPREPGHTFTLRPGQTLHIGGTPIRCRAYLCVPGGFDVPSVLGSATGLEPLKAGDVLTCQASQVSGRSLALDDNADPDLRREGSALRCLPGPQADWFTDAFYSHTYKVTLASNRMGVRLEGPTLVMPICELVSEPVAPGAVQITNDGQPIVLGVD